MRIIVSDGDERTGTQIRELLGSLCSILESDTYDYIEDKREWDRNHHWTTLDKNKKWYCK